MSKYSASILIIVITLAIFVLTRNAITGTLKLQMALVSILGLITYGFSLKKRGLELSTNKSFIYSVIATDLFLVGATGWFFSPFFFSLYLMTILLSFLFSPAVSYAFAGTLIALFSVNIGEVDLAYDFLVVLSLLTTVPLSLYLRKEYLNLKQGKKDILILEDHKKSESKVEGILANKVNRLAVDLRQPINDVKLMAYQLGKRTKGRDKMIAACEESLRVIKEFEGEVTGTAPLLTPTRNEPKSLLHSLPIDQD